MTTRPEDLTETDLSINSAILCPHCGEEDRNCWKLIALHRLKDGDKIKDYRCPKCDKPVAVTFYLMPAWTTAKLDAYQPPLPGVGAPAARG